MQAIKLISNQENLLHLYSIQIKVKWNWKLKGKANNVGFISFGSGFSSYIGVHLITGLLFCLGFPLPLAFGDRSASCIINLAYIFQFYLSFLLSPSPWFLLFLYLSPWFLLFLYLLQGVSPLVNLVSLYGVFCCNSLNISFINEIVSYLKKITF